MNITLWIVASLLALAFLAAGGVKIFQPQKKLAASGMGWTEDSKPAAIKAIGVTEILGAAGMILPAVTGIASYLVPLAATGLAIVMVGAAITHLKRGEKSMALVSVVLAVLALVVAVGRFGAWAF
ncbi:DoxX family protein [Paenarthrobacter aromaticivorans]|uniref:DoxX family protein n=1 Tax=Paenarthrobacter aromaticivorans TaxID=2849150 RepID=A0ABS6I1M3_9MICC|nr:DoxX family protein [Paenarthrobacter sp. MMS21-TAE1-1]MBU8865646.1 DoxX family protein [Paenarthrobacter sp. MMS21-TAE1-1]